MTQARAVSAEPTRKSTKPRPTKGRDTALTNKVISDEDRRQMIREAAYYRAERRGFAGGDPEQDWLEAEAEINSRLSEG